MGSVTIQKTAPVPGWALNTCLEKLWKHRATNGIQLYSTPHLYFSHDIETPEQAVIHCLQIKALLHLVHVGLELNSNKN